MSPVKLCSIGGTVSDEFAAVEETFRKNFRKGFEREGAAFAVYFKGRLVVDLWGGFADKRKNVAWQQDTISVVMSCTKAVTATVVAMLVDRGLLCYDDLVSKHWPEFARNGKEAITVKMLLCHQAGLAAFDEPLDLEILQDSKQLSKIIEHQRPNWQPGTAYGYHAISFGFIIDQLVRRVDPKGRSVGQFLAEEITRPNDIDFHIGLPSAEFSRLARCQLSPLFLKLKYLARYAILRRYAIQVRRNTKQHLATKSTSNPPIHKYVEMPAGYTVEMAGANGVGTARGLAKIFALLVEGKLISQSLIEKISQPINAADGKQPDIIYGLPIVSGWGFAHTRSPNGDRLVGYAGFGGQNVKFDQKNQLVFAYIHNGLVPDMGNTWHAPSFQALQTSVYECLNNMQFQAQAKPEAIANKQVVVERCM